MQIHSRKMNTNKDVNFEELSRCTDDFNGAQCKAVCIEAVCLSSFHFTNKNCIFLGYDCITSRWN
jgi:ATP-dependent 26S proteasome regulatory subunit